MSKWSDSTIIKGADGVTERPIAVDEDGNIKFVGAGALSPGSPATQETLSDMHETLQYMCSLLRINNEYLARINSEHITIDDVDEEQ